MSINIDWETLTTGPEGQELAHSIRDFVHDKFQEVELPRFIRSVQIHSFDFGKECPVVELKDICDPLPEFYENDEEEEDEEEEEDDSGQSLDAVRTPQDTQRPRNGFSQDAASLSNTKRPTFIDTRLPGLRLGNPAYTEHIATPFLSRSNTPGIPGGTSNLSYFHLPLSTGLSGSQTPLAAVAGGHPHPTGWPDHRPYSRQHSPIRREQHHPEFLYADPSSRPSTADSYAQHDGQSQEALEDESPSNKSSPKLDTPHPSDLQVVLHISYSGSVRLSITAEILLDYPMPSFVGIPLKLNITGLSFDGVALIAYLRKRAHFCFLSTEDAQTLVGVDGGAQGEEGRKKGTDKLGGLLREIRVESEIGRKEGGKQVLKNVGKVEKFVLEQVRQIFENEFVWPSFWTFLV